MKSRGPGPLNSMLSQSGGPGFPSTPVAELLNRLRAEIEASPQLRRVRVQVYPKGGDTLPGYEPYPSHLQRGWAAWIQEVRRAGRMNSKHGPTLVAVHPLRLVRLQAKSRGFWDDNSWIPAKLAILALLVLLAAAI